MATRQSTRRAAEQAVINAAHQYVADPQGPGNYRRLIAAVEEHERLGLETPGKAIIANDAGETSSRAPELSDLGKLARECLDEIMTVHNNGGVGLTCDQLEQVMKREHQTVSARVNELRDKGWLMDSTVRRKTRRNRPAIVWMPTYRAREQAR